MREQRLRYNINLIKDNRIPRKIRLLVYRIAAVYLFACVVAAVTLAVVYVKDKHRVAVLSKELASVKAVYGDDVSNDDIKGDAVVYKNLLSRNLQQLSQVNSIISERINIAPKMERLSYLLPPHTWIDRIDYLKKESRMVFAGATVIDRRFEVTTLTGEFIRSLKNDPVFMKGFSDVRLISTERRTIDGVDALVFSISCFMKDAAGGVR